MLLYPGINLKITDLYGLIRQLPTEQFSLSAWYRNVAEICT